MKELSPVEFLSMFHENSVTLKEDLFILNLNSWKDKIRQILQERLLFSSAYKGTFNGNGHTIHNVNGQLCSEIWSGGVIKNVTIKSDTSYTKPIICDENNGVLKNITVECDIEGNSDTIGGLVRKNNNKIINCEFKGDIEHKRKVGGIAGKNQGTIKNCKTNGVIEGKSKVGGICGVNKYKIRENSVVNSCVSADSSTCGGITGMNYGSIKDSVVKNTNICSISISGGICGIGLNGHKIVESIVEDAFIKTTFIGGGVAGVSEWCTCRSTISNAEISSENISQKGFLFGVLQSLGDINNCYYYGPNVTNMGLLGTGEKDNENMLTNYDSSKDKTLCILNL